MPNSAYMTRGASNIGEDNMLLQAVDLICRSGNNKKRWAVAQILRAIKEEEAEDK